MLFLQYEFVAISWAVMLFVQYELMSISWAVMFFVQYEFVAISMAVMLFVQYEFVAISMAVMLFVIIIIIIYYAFIRSIQGHKSIGYRTCHWIVDKEKYSG